MTSGIPAYTCPHCNKQTYQSRGAAKRAERNMTSRVGRLTAYACPTGHGRHLGHLPPDIIAGHRDRSSL